MTSKQIHSLIFIALSSLLVGTGCGRVNRKPFYDDTKDYGRTPVAIAPVGDPADAESPGLTPAPVIIDTPAPSTVVASVLFKGAVDLTSLRFITAGGTTLDPKSMPGWSYLTSYFEGDQSILLYGRQTYGDEVTGISRLIQDGIAGAADLGVTIGGESESGTQILERHIGNDKVQGACPTAAVCIASMVWKPNLGKIKTYCYRDAATGETTLIPYAPAPNFPAKDAQKAAGSYGPYQIQTYDGEVDCLSPAIDQKPEDSHNVMIRFLYNPKPAFQYLVKQRNKITADYSVRVIVDKLGRESPANEQPYVDAFSRMQGESEFFISAREKSLLKVVKRTRKSINFPGDDSWIGSLVRGFNYVSPITGILMDVHAEHCVDFMDATLQNFCHAADMQGRQP